MPRSRRKRTQNAARRWPAGPRFTCFATRSSAGLDVLVDGASIGQTRRKTFYRIQLAPGEHLLTSRNPQNDSLHEHRFRADAGSLLFLEQRVRFGMTTMRHDLVPAEQAAATSRIRRCRLLLPAPAAS